MPHVGCRDRRNWFVYPLRAGVHLRRQVFKNEGAICSQEENRDGYRSVTLRFAIGLAIMDSKCVDPCGTGRESCDAAARQITMVQDRSVQPGHVSCMAVSAESFIHDRVAGFERPSQASAGASTR